MRGNTDEDRGAAGFCFLDQRLCVFSPDFGSFPDVGE